MNRTREAIKGIKPLYQFYRFLRKSFMTSKEREAVFKRIFDRNYWGNSESVSGLGSTMNETEEIRKLIPGLIIKYNIQSLLDAPCGDFNWMKEVNLDGINYTGIDIVGDLIRKNQKQYSSKNIQFKKLDLVTDKIPKADLILNRDCLVHMSFADIKKALSNMKQSGCKYLLTTSFVNKASNSDIDTGQWRPINLEIAPFEKLNIIERIDEKNQLDPGKHLLLIQLN